MQNNYIQNHIESQSDIFKNYIKEICNLLISYGMEKYYIKFEIEEEFNIEDVWDDIKTNIVMESRFKINYSFTFYEKGNDKDIFQVKEWLKIIKEIR